MLVSVAEHLAAKEPDVSLSSWWKPRPKYTEGSLDFIHQFVHPLIRLLFVLDLYWLPSSVAPPVITQEAKETSKSTFTVGETAGIHQSSCFLPSR